jgi:hypothetical protein
MLQQHSLNLIATNFGSLIQNKTKLAVLILSLALVGCGGSNERPVPSTNFTDDGVAPRISGANVNSVRGQREVFARASNKCNLGPTVSAEQEVLFEVSASESVMPPIIMVDGVKVEMTGKNYSWQGVFDMDDLPALSEYSHDDGIPYTISVTDSSGLSSNLLDSTDDLKFCVQDAPVGDTGTADCSCYPEDISGVWQLRQKANAMGVGQSEGVTQDWAIDDVGLTTRSCVFDDTYTFDLDESDVLKMNGTFEIDMGDSTWLEPWQSGDVERCGDPQFPFNGLNADGTRAEFNYVWDRNNKSLKLLGVGAHIGLPRVANFKENKSGTATNVDYTLETANNCLITLNIQSGGPSPWWHFEIEKVLEADGTPPQCNEEVSSYVPVPVPSIYSTAYDGMPASSVALDITEPFSTDPNALDQPVENNDQFRVPEDFVTNPANPEAGFINPTDTFSLYTYYSDKGSDYVSALAENNAAQDNLRAKEEALREFDSDEGAENETDEDTSVSPEEQSAQEEYDLAADRALQAAAALDLAIYKENTLQFGDGGYIYLRASVPSGGEAELYFKLSEYYVDPLTGELSSDPDADQDAIQDYQRSLVPLDTEISDVITIKGSETGFYGIEINDLNARSFNSIAMYITTGDTEVLITDIRVVTTEATDASIRGPFVFGNVSQSGPIGDDPATPELETDKPLGNDGQLLGPNNAWPDIIMPADTTTTAMTYMVSSAYFEDPNKDGEVDNPGAYAALSLDDAAVIDVMKSALTFGNGGALTFTASVPSGFANIRFRLERIGSEYDEERKPTCTLPTSARVIGAEPTEYQIFIPPQAHRTFRSVAMFIDTPDQEVTIDNIRLQTTPLDPTKQPVDCSSEEAMFGDKVLDMTSPFGDARIDTRNVTNPETNIEESVALFRTDSARTLGFDGYAILRPSPDALTLLELAPAAFGEAGSLSFTASIPTLQQVGSVPITNAQSAVEIEFKFEREPSESGDSCKTEPSYTTDIITVSGAEDTYTIDIPAQGVNQFRSLIMKLLTEDTQVQISNITISTNPPEAGQIVRAADCLSAPYPSQYFDFQVSEDDFDGDGIDDTQDPDDDNDGLLDGNEGEKYNYTPGYSIAAVFTGTYGGEGGGSNTTQFADQFNFPIESESYGGWSNDNTSFYPMTFNSRINGTSRIAFCASTVGTDVKVYFRVEDQPHPNNLKKKDSEHVSIEGGNVIKPYIAEFPTLTGGFNSLQMYVTERDMIVQIGKVIGNWNFDANNLGLDGKPKPHYLLNKDNNLTSADLEADNFCNDFPVEDTDEDGVKDNVDMFPYDNTKATIHDFDGDGIFDLLDTDMDNDGSLNEDDCDDEDPLIKILVGGNCI